MFVIAEITGRALSPFVALRAGKLYEAGRKSRGDHWSPAPTAGIAAPAGSVAAKFEFRWSEFNFALSMLC